MRGQRAWHVSNINVASRALHVGLKAVSAGKLVAADVNSDGRDIGSEVCILLRKTDNCFPQRSGTRCQLCAILLARSQGW